MVVLALLLVPAVILVGIRQLSPKASNAISIQVSPGAIDQSSSPQIGKPVYLSATAVDEVGRPITTGVSYIWGMSSNFPISPTFKPSNNLATFTPNSTGSGSLWVSAITSQSSAIKYLDICIGVPCPTYSGSTPTPTPITYDPNNFTDVDKNSWSWKYILQIVPLGLISPRTPTTFEPTGSIPRVEMAQFLSNTYRYLKSTEAPIVSTPFTDISGLPRNQQDAIARVYGLGLTAGTSTTTFSPTMLVDRAQTAVFLVKLYKLITNIDPPLIKTPFTDLTDPDIAYSQNWVPKLYGLKITAGISPTLYGPKLQVTREQMTAFLSNILHAISTTPTPTPTCLPMPTQPPCPLGKNCPIPDMPAPPPGGYCPKPTPTPTPTTPLPDLAIFNPIVASPNPAKITDQVLVSFKISNLGSSVASSAQYSYTNQADGSSQVHSSNTCVNSTSLKPGESCVSAYLFTFKSSGSKTLTVRLDPNNILKESNENNNDYSVTLTVLSPTPTPTICSNPPSCPNPPAGCSYEGGNCSSCGTLVCKLSPTPTPTPIARPTPTPTPTPIPNKPPTITTQFFSIGFVGRSYLTSVTATDPNLNDNLTAKITGLPSKLVLTGCIQSKSSVRNLNCTISGTPYSFGTFPIKITVTDSANASTTKTIYLPIFKKYLLF